MPSPAEPYRDAQSHLDDHLARIARAFDGDAVGALLELDLRIAAREAATEIALPLRVLRDQAGLDHRAVRLLVLAALPVLDAELAARLRDRIRGVSPTVGELLANLGLAESEAGALVAVLTAASPLRAHGLVIVSADEGAPLLHRKLYVDARVAAFLRGEGLFEQVPASQVGSTIASAIEQQIKLILVSPRSCETIEHAFRRKEQELMELFASLTVVEARVLHRRLANPSIDDAIATLFGRLVVERRLRLLAFLAGARRRYALGPTAQRSWSGGR